MEFFRNGMTKKIKKENCLCQALFENFRLYRLFYRLQRLLQKKNWGDFERGVAQKPEIIWQNPSHGQIVV